ncbi:MAG: precorrin-2 dehydrogenase/sirohydrochlorin ferrochelatase family protein [Chloroflexota bacterium]
MERHFYPIALDLHRKSCLVAGGTEIAADKVEGLLAAGARVTVASPVAIDRIAHLARAGRIAWSPRTYRSSDLAGVYLAYGASDDLPLNARLAAECRARGILVNAVDDPPNCDFFAMALVRRGDLQIAISTNGRSPAFARWVRERLEDSLPGEYGTLLALLASIRAQMKREDGIPPYERWKEALSAAVLAHVRAGDGDAARDLLVQSLAPSGRLDRSAAPARLAAVR